ncbi:hypothetical protein Aperf_G00000006490 [Anoplocephala perfoliata]
MIGDTGDPLVKALTSNNVCRSIKLRLLYTLQKKWLVMNNQDNSVIANMSEDEKKTITADSEYLEWLLTVIVKHLPRSAVKTLLAFSSEHPLSYIPVANSNPNCIPDRSRRLGCLLEILDLLIERNSDACQTLAELGGIMIIAALIQVCPPA